jgi:hypothetical protein
MRPDLLSLTPDDLATFSNRGVVKRAQRELEEGKLDAEITESTDGTVTVVWPEGITCTLPHNATLPDSQCTCPAMGVCRHLVQSVLLYQLQATEEAPQAAPEPWNPGDISDEMLATHYTKAVLSRLRNQFEDDHIFELVRGVKPLARIHTLSCSVRFLVPGDPRYTACDCAEPAPCSHVALAVWAFRLLDGEAGLIETGHEQFTPPLSLLDELENGLGDLLELGFAGASTLAIGRLHQLAGRCRDSGLIWHGEILDEIAQEYDRYAAQDARFSAVHTATLVGELLIRNRAVRNPTDAVPGLFVRGSAADVATHISASRMIGLGCAVEPLKGATRLSVYLQEADSGQIVAIQREFEPQADQEPPPFWQLGRSTLMSDTSFGALGRQQLLVKGGKRTAESVFVPGRTKASVVAQPLNWEALRAPLLADSFAEIRARRAAQPPAALRPRRVGEDLQVCAVKSVENAIFDPFNQAVVTQLIDHEGGSMLMIHPYTSRGSEGIDALLWHLQNRALKFVCGSVRPGGIVAPLSLVFEKDGKRYLVQPWIQRREAEMNALPSTLMDEQHSSDPLIYYPRQVMAALSEVLLNGLQRSSGRTAEQWQRLAQEGHMLGFVRLVEPITKITDFLAQKQHRLDWEWRRAASLILDMLALARFAQEDFTD